MCTSQSDTSTHSSLLLASISSSGPEANSRASAGVGREQASVSRRHSTRSSKIKYDAVVDNVLTSHALNRGEIHRAGAELQKVVAFVGGMLLAGVSKAQHHVERSKRHLQWSDLTFYHDVMTDRERQVVNMKALEYAERAIVEHPNSPGGYLAMCISKGRLGLFMDNKTKVKLAKEAQEAATTAIRLGPDNDVAHHLMGRDEGRSAGVVQKGCRIGSKKIDSSGGDWQGSAELGQKDEAKRYLQEALEQDIEDINAWQTRFDAEEMLAQIDKKPWTKPSLVPPGSKGYSTPAALSTAALLGVPEHTLHGKDK
eukprot:jgi/Picre1/27325/NNA_000294.t1